MRTWTPTVSHYSIDTPYSPCEVVPTSRTPRHKKHTISKTAHKNVSFALFYTVHFHQWMRSWTPTVSHDSNDTIFTMWGCAHFENTSSQETHKFKNPPTKMLTLHYVIRCIFKNECADEPLRCPTVPTTLFPQCEVVPTWRTLDKETHKFKKIALENVNVVLC